MEAFQTEVTASATACDEREREPDVSEELKEVDEAKSLGCAGSAQRPELELPSQRESRSVVSDSLWPHEL